MSPTTNTHMPFMAKHGTETISLCCRKINGIWKLHRKINDQWVQLNTRRPVDAIECSPTAEYVNGQWRISFISGGAEGDRLFRLHQYIDGEVSVIKEPAFVGFVNRKFLAYGGREKQFTLEMVGGSEKMIFESENLEELFRLSYDAQYPHRLLISGRYNGGICSWIYNLGNNNFYDVEADGVPAYKCAFFNGKCYYARQVGDGFEDREVVEAQEVKITPLGRDVLTVRREK